MARTFNDQRSIDAIVLRASVSASADTVTPKQTCTEYIHTTRRERERMFVYNLGSWEKGRRAKSSKRTRLCAIDWIQHTLLYTLRSFYLCLSRHFSFQNKSFSLFPFWRTGKGKKEGPKIRNTNNISEIRDTCEHGHSTHTHTHRRKERE